MNSLSSILLIAILAAVAVVMIALAALLWVHVVIAHRRMRRGL